MCINYFQELNRHWERCINKGEIASRETKLSKMQFVFAPGMDNITAPLVFLLAFAAVYNSPIRKKQVNGNEGTLPCCEEIEAQHQAECTTGKGLLWNVVLGIFLFFLILLLLGCIKGSMGLCCPYVGVWGLDTLVEHRQPITCYYETELSGRPVICDCHGFPLHPDTKDRTVHVYSRTTECCLNFIFFLAYPVALCSKCCKSHEKEDIKGLCVPGCNPDKCYGSQLEEEDVRFVLEQLNLSRDSLRRCICDATEQTPLQTEIKEEGLQESDKQGFGNEGFIDGEAAPQKNKGEIRQRPSGSEDYIPSHSDLSNDVDQYELLEQMQQFHNADINNND